MKLYILDGGQVNLPSLSHLTPGRNLGTPVTIPIPMFLIEHPGGLVVVDTGVNADRSRDPLLDVQPEQRIDRQIEALGYAAADVRYVILTHLHHDHMGGATFLPQTTFVVRRAELRSAWWPDAYEGGYNFDILLPTRDLRYLQVPDGVDFDLFQDGSIVCLDTRGHTEGHQSVLVAMPNSGRVVLVGDAIPVRQNLTEKIPPGLCWNSQLAIWAIEKLQHMEEEGALLVLGHDPSQLSTLRRAPEYYD